MLKCVLWWLQAGVTSSSGYLPCEPATTYYCLTGSKHPLTSDATAFTGTVSVCHAGLLLLLTVITVTLSVRYPSYMYKCVHLCTLIEKTWPRYIFRLDHVLVVHKPSLLPLLLDLRIKGQRQLDSLFHFIEPVKVQYHVQLQKSD